MFLKISWATGSLKIAPGRDMPSTPRQRHWCCQLHARELGATSLPTAVEGDVHPNQPETTAHLTSLAAPTKASGWSQTTSVRKRTIPRVDVAMVRVSQLIPAAASGLVSAVGSSAHKSAQLLQLQSKFTPGRVSRVSCCRHRRSTRQGHPEHTPAPLGIPGLLSSPRTLCSGTSQFGRASAAFNL